jgi:membrane-associated phospholipid phosphatase
MRLRSKHLGKLSSSLLAVLIFIPTFLFAQRDSLAYRPDVLRFADGVAFTLSAPARWDRGDWLVLGGMIAGTAAVSFADEPFRDFWQKQDNNFLNGVERVGYHYGKPYSAISLSAGFYLSGVIFKSEWAKETGLMLGTSIFSSSLVMGVLKTAAGRGRPGVQPTNLEFKPFEDSPAYHAFPSGHSSVAFGISVLLARRVEPVPLKILFYSLAGTTVVSRMYSDAHWFSDIAFGGMIAWFCADTAIERIQKNRFRSVRIRNQLVWKVYPYPGGVSFVGMVR